MVILVATYAYATISTYGFLNPQLPPSGFYWVPSANGPSPRPVLRP